MSPEAKRKAAFVTNEGLFQFRVMPRLRSSDSWTAMRWSRYLVYLDDIISFGKSIPEALSHLEEVLARLSDFGLQLKAKKCAFMQTEVGFLGHIVGRSGLACDPEKLLAGRNWHEPNRVKAVHQFVGFCRILSPICEIFCRTRGTISVSHAEECSVCLDRSTANSLMHSRPVY